MKVDLVWITENKVPPSWPYGIAWALEPSSSGLAGCVEMNLPRSDSDAWLFWDSTLGRPDPGLIDNLLSTPDDLWHAGLKLGTGGEPDFIDYVSATWMLNRDPDPEIEATSWRVSLRACLVRTEVLRQMGGPSAAFTTLEAAGLEMGFRYIRKGVFLRHVPSLVHTKSLESCLKIPIEDQLRFIRAGFGEKWTRWACLRSVLSRRARLKEILNNWWQGREYNTVKFKPYQHLFIDSTNHPIEGRVSVLIPTLNRYSYLRILLGQLRAQTIKPIEILVVDQTPEADRERLIRQEFTDLPIHWLDLHPAGQCSSRNLGLYKAQGDFILFIDDDDEIPNTLIESHLRNLSRFRINVSNGIAFEVDAGPIPIDFTFLRISNVFPTNNTLIRKEILSRSGLFDLAYDRGQRADGDLGMRVYLSGERMVLNPDISALHHHAPQGGLRTHKARVHTYAASRSKITNRDLPSISDIYLARRYFSTKQVREMLWTSVIGTFSLHGPRWKQALKIFTSFLAIPQTIHHIRTCFRKADAMLRIFPQIPDLNSQKIDHATAHSQF